MSPLSIVDSGILYINPDPAHRHVSAFFPTVVQLGESEFLCLYQRGDGMYATNSTLGRLRSVDGGATWQDESVLRDASPDDRHWSLHCTFLSGMSDGRLVVFAMRADRSDPARPMFSETGGITRIEPLLFESYDGGRTWAPPRVTTLGKDLVVSPAQSIIELASGRWLAVVDEWRAYHDPRPYEPRMLGFFSDDQGRTWSDPTVIADKSRGGRGYWHGRPIRLRDGGLFSLFWTADMSDVARGPVNLPIHAAAADAAGQQWETPYSTGIPGQTNCVTELPDGRLAAIYTDREGARPGFLIVLSHDRGRTWNLDDRLRVWDATGWTQIGVSSPDRYPRSHDTIAFGAPSLMTTQQGELLASWWCTFASLTHLRWARVVAG